MTICRRVPLVQFLCARDRLTANHCEMIEASSKVAFQRLTHLPQDFVVCFIAVEVAHRLELYGTEIVFGLGFSEWIVIDELSINLAAILTKRRCRELKNGFRLTGMHEPCAKFPPRPRFDMVRLVNKQGATELRHTLLHAWFSTTGD